MTAAFILAGTLGLGVLAVSLLFGSTIGRDADALAPHKRALSPPVIGACLATFGFAGTIAVELGELAPLWATAAALALGLLAAAGLVSVTRTAPTTARPTATPSLVGERATVIQAIPPGGEGTIRLPGFTRDRTLTARANTAIRQSAAVEIVTVVSPTTVVVRMAPSAPAGDEPSAAEPAGAGEPADADAEPAGTPAAEPDEPTGSEPTGPGPADADEATAGRRWRRRRKV